MERDNYFIDYLELKLYYIHNNLLYNHTLQYQLNTIIKYRIIRDYHTNIKKLIATL